MIAMSICAKNYPPKSTKKEFALFKGIFEYDTVLQKNSATVN